MLADVGNTLKVTVTAKNAAGETSATSASAEVLPAPPVNTKLPQVEGITQDGKTLSATNGEWEGTPTITYTYQWQDCDALGEGCLDISGASASTYELTPADVNSTLKVIVTAKNAAGETPATSSASAEVTATGPVNKALPAIKGEAQDEQTLTAEDGEWEGTPPITFTYQWQRCDSSGNNCTDIAGASASTYKLTPADVGNTVKVTVTAKNTAGTTPATSPASAEVTAATPTNVKLPAISGTTKDEQTLSAENGEWKGTPPITYTYQWQRCDSSGNNCTDISGASASTYKLTPADVDSTLKVTVTAKNAAGETPATSPASAEVTATGPANTELPQIQGTAQEGQTLTATNGEWEGTPTITYTYQWQRCDSSGNNCNPISGATEQHYTAVLADVGNTLKVTVTAKNAAGETPATSASAEVLPAPPVNTKLPQIEGITQDGKTLSATNGDWEGTPTITYTYQWQGCDALGEGCLDISGASASTYELTPADVGSTLKVIVTAKNAAGETPATSSASAVVTATGPVNKALPAITGEAQDEQTLTAEDGKWEGTPPITFTYQWQRCDSSGNNCTDISGASASTYGLTPGDVGSTLKVIVTAKNTAGETPATSPASAVVVASAPAVVEGEGPAISGTAQDEQTLTAEDGTWTESPTSFTYQWQRCDSSGNNCNPISGASASTYGLTPADVGSTVKVIVTAKNTAGETPATSPASAEVTAATPTNVKLPAISGTTKDEQTLSAENGEWKGTPTITYTYQWQRCDSSGNNCTDIEGASASTYKLTPADVNSTLKVTVTAKNAAGETPATSPASAEVTATGPANTELPQVQGTAQEGQTLTATNGEWEGTPPITYTYQWQRCDSSGNNCNPISGATEQHYTAVLADVGNTLKVTVTAKNAAGETSATSASAEVLPAPPVNTKLPQVEGITQDGKTLSATNGEWEGTPTITYTYQWQDCDALGEGCLDISGASASTYELTPADVNSTLKVIVTAKNAAGETPATSSASAEVTATGPVNKALPAIKGEAQDEQTLTAEDGEWEGTPPITFTYQWQRCDSSGNNCTDIQGASASTYGLTPGDVGSTVKVIVTAKNTAGETPATSPASAVVVASAPAVVEGEGPAISGTAQDEQTLTAEDGTWTESPTSFTYQWQRCDSSGNNCNPISGASASTYGLTPADVGSTVKVIVTAKNTAGETPATSPASAEVTAATPTNVKLPAISGTTKDEQTLSAENGEWKGTPPITYTYQWQRCDSSGNNCTDIEGASASTYKLTPADVNSTLKVTVTAKNAAGETPATSPASAEVTATGPANTELPQVQGTAQEGQTLTATNGEWEGTPPITYTYQWQRCDSSGNNCNPISGATEQHYTAVLADVGNTLKVTVTAKNAAGETSATSASAEVLPAPPVNTKLPQVEGITQDGKTLSATNGEWEGTPTITYTYQWQDCDALGEGCLDISGASASTYELTPADVNSTLKVIVTAKNAAGETPATSSASAEVTATGPVNKALPAIKGEAQDEQTLTAEDGEWEGTPPITYTYQWQRCDSSGNNCNPTPAPAPPPTS